MWATQLEEINAVYTQFFVASSYGGHVGLMRRDFEKFLDRAISICDNLPPEIHKAWADYRKYEYNGKKLSMQDSLYWSMDHMRLTLSDIEDVKAQAEARIREWYGDNEQLDIGFLDLVRRTMHGIKIVMEDYENIRAWLDEAEAAYKEKYGDE